MQLNNPSLPAGLCYRSIVMWLSIAFSLLQAPAMPQIRTPDDAPKPLSPAESAASVSLPDGFELQLVASEPLIRTPSGVCWDGRGRLFVCELHGYNMEGQYDVEELNKTGKLDRIVRRIPAPQTALEKAARDQTGSVKRLIDLNGDGVMDDAEIWADDLNACFGLVPAREGVIVVCAPDIVYLADKDDDGVAETRETLFTGFRMGVLERRMSAPQWGSDDWIYVAGGGGTITGPRLEEPVELPRNDFRFKADGSAIEPLTAGTWTFGFTFSNTGDRFVISTGSPAIYEAPLPWRYLKRNPHVGFGRMTVDVSPGQKTFPTSKPHPWRTRRANDPGFEELYRTRYGAAESAPNGFFTSACSPLIYKDSALPLSGQLLACEPAQNMIHRSIVSRQGLVPRLSRPNSELNSEFLASTDIWFHPIAMSHAPDGSIVICDFYREIIEDYSAIPRYLQQEYQLKHGEQHGRLWRLVHRDMPKPESHNLDQASTAALVDELQSPRFWRRQTAKRLLLERDDPSITKSLRQLIHSEKTSTAILTLHTLNELGGLTTQDLLVALGHNDPAVAVAALRFADKRFDAEPRLLESAFALLKAKDERLKIQLALSLGESHNGRSRQALVKLALHSGDIRWMDDALLSSSRTVGSEFLSAILGAAKTQAASESLVGFTSRLTKMIAESRNSAALSSAILSITNCQNPELATAAWRGVSDGIHQQHQVELTVNASSAIRSATEHRDAEIATAARELVVALGLESKEERLRRLTLAAETVTAAGLEVELRVTAVAELAGEGDETAMNFLIKCFRHSTPIIRKAIVDTLVKRRKFRPGVLDAMESNQLPPSALSAVQRDIFVNDANPETRHRARSLFEKLDRIDPEKSARFVDALHGKRDLKNGLAVFKKHCSTCHKVRGIGVDVGPSLVSEFGRNEQTYIHDILNPSAKISAGFETYILLTLDGRIIPGLIFAESATSISLKTAEGKKQTILRKDIESIRASEVSLMPNDLEKSLSPKDVADLIAWLRAAN